MKVWVWYSGISWIPETAVLSIVPYFNNQSCVCKYCFACTVSRSKLGLKWSVCLRVFSCVYSKTSSAKTISANLGMKAYVSPEPRLDMR